MTDFAAARAMMEEIRALGCSLAIDDFGVRFCVSGVTSKSCLSTMSKLTGHSSARCARTPAIRF